MSLVIRIAGIVLLICLLFAVVSELFGFRSSAFVNIYAIVFISAGSTILVGSITMMFYWYLRPEAFDTGSDATLIIVVLTTFLFIGVLFVSAVIGLELEHWGGIISLPVMALAYIFTAAIVELIGVRKKLWFLVVSSPFRWGRRYKDMDKFLLAQLIAHRERIDRIIANPPKTFLSDDILDRTKKEILQLTRSINSYFVYESR